MASIPATLYRRLAEVIDGLRTGRTAFFVLALEFPHDPLTSQSGETGFESEGEALDALKRTDGGLEAFQVFGPCKTQREVSRLTVTSVTTLSDGATKTRNVHPDTDLICWSMSAFDKFVVPYYFQLYGRNEVAYGEIAKLRRWVKETGIFAHKWPTKGSGSIKDYLNFGDYDPWALPASY